MLEPKPNLAYTLAIDPPGHGGTRQMAKMLAASLLRTFWSGEVLVFRNTPRPLFLVQRGAVEEVYLEIDEQEWMRMRPSDKNTEFDDGEIDDFRGSRDQRPERWTKVKADSLAQYAMRWKSRARDFIDASRYEWIMFLDADCLALRNLDHLLPKRDGVWRLDGEPPDIIYQTERGRTVWQGVFDAYLAHGSSRHRDRKVTSKRRADAEGADCSAPASERPFLTTGVNSGTWAVRGEHYCAVMEEWERIQQKTPLGPTRWREQGAWNLIVADCIAGKLPWRAKPFEAREIQFPLHLDKDWKHYKNAALLHAMGGSTHEKIEFLFGMFMQKFFGDPETTLINIFEM